MITEQNHNCLLTIRDGRLIWISIFLSEIVLRRIQNGETNFLQEGLKRRSGNRSAV